MSLIKLQAINKIYGKGDNIVRALKDINLTIEKGELLSIIGTSGSGKSTMLNLLGLLDRQSEGNYFFNDRAINDFSKNELADLRNLEIGFVFQSFFLIPKLTAEQNVMLPLLYRDISTAKASEQAKKMLNRFDIAHLSHHLPSQMSGGQQQRVALARALVGDPEVILADEPTGALDSKTSQSVMDAFHDLRENENKTIIIVTHDLHVAEQCCRIVQLKDGEIIDDRRNSPIDTGSEQ